MNIRTRTVLLLAGILGLALILRLWGIGFGLPYPYHYDEKAYTGTALNLGAGIIGRQTFPTGFSHILLPQMAAYYLIGKLTGIFSSTADFERLYRVDPSVFLLLGRLTSVLLGVITCLVVYGLGRVLRNRGTGLLGALFLAVAFLHVRDSHYAVPDVAMPFFIGLTVLLCVLAVHQQKNWYFILSAVCGGFAIATKWSAWPVVITLSLTAWYLRQAVVYGRRRDRFIWLAGIPVLAFLGGFVLGGFELLIKPLPYLTYALNEWRYGEGGGFNIWQIDTLSGWAFYFKTLFYGLGILLLALAVVGGVAWTIAALRSRDRASLIVLSFPLVYFLFMGATRHYFARYALPLLPFAMLFAAEAVRILAAWGEKRRSGLGWGLAVVVVVLAIAQPLVASVRHDVLLTRVDTRTLAKQWIETNLPAGSLVAVDWLVHGPPLATADKPTANSARTYDVRVIDGAGLSDRPLSWYRENGFDYLIASSYIYDVPLVDAQRNAARRDFYASLDRDLQTAAVFAPANPETQLAFVFDEIYGPLIDLWARERPGPTLKVYRVP